MANYNQPKFEHVKGPGKGEQLPVAASQAFARRGGKFVYVSTAGAVTLVGDCGTSIRGWAVIPKDASATNFWTSDSTAKEDEIYVISGLEDIFEIPYHNASASVNASVVGNALGIYNTGGVQKAQEDCAAASECLIVSDFDTNENTVWVRIKPGCFK